MNYNLKMNTKSSCIAEVNQHAMTSLESKAKGGRAIAAEGIEMREQRRSV